MRRRKILLLSAPVLVVILLALAYSLKKNISHYAIVGCLQSKGIEISFSVDTFRFDEIVISDVTLDKNITLPHVQINLSAGQPSGITALIDHLDLPTLKEVLKKLSSSSTEQTNFHTLSDQCQLAKDMDIDIQIKAATWDTIQLPLALQLLHKKTQSNLTLAFSGQTTENQKSPQLTVGPLSYSGQLSVLCSEKTIETQIHSLSVKVKMLMGSEMTPLIRRLDLSLQKGAVTIGDNEKIKLHLPAALHLDSQIKDKNILLDEKSFILSGSSALAEPQKGQFNISGQGLHLGSPQKLDFKKWDLLLDTLDPEFSGTFHISGLEYKNPLSQALLNQVNLSGQFNQFSGKYSVALNISDSEKILNLKDLNFTYDTKSSTYTLTFKDHASAVHLNNKMAEIFPLYGKPIHSAEGTLSLSGSLTSQGEGFVGDLAIQGQKISMNTEYGQFKNLNIHHNILNIPSLKSSKNQSLTLDEINAGVILEKVKINYQVLELSRIEVSHMEFTYDDALFVSKAFLLNASQKRVENFKATIKGFPLKKLLAIGLKDTVSATGFLSGEIAVNYHGPVPTMEGQLTAESPGSIQYRTGQLQETAIHLSDGPMNILYAYLYDFQYKTLSVDIKTDDKYKMNMKLSTFGHNDNYLKGKPLKLNVNLEQNLLAAIQSMMLTYDLPNKIKEHLEKVGPQ
jgi:hypothetical protein